MHEKNIQVAAENKQIVKQGFYKIGDRKIDLLGDDLDMAIVISPDIKTDLSQAEKFEHTFFDITNLDSFGAVKFFGGEKTLVMNFANAHSPGGGYLSGANAQEEALCRESTLYKSLSSLAAKPMYNYNRKLSDKGKLGIYCASDYMILSPNVCVFRDIHDNFLEEPFLTAAITTPAPNLKGGARNVPQDELNKVMTARLEKMFIAAIHYGYKNLILGAWGCGAFGHNPRTVAKYFYDLLINKNYRNYFEKIIFAIYSIKSGDRNFEAFSKVFYG